MKNTNFKLLLVVSLIITSCSTNAIKDPTQIGKQVFGILKDISSTSKSNYVANFLSIEELRELGKNDRVVTDESTRNEMTSTLREDWDSEIEEYYNDIKVKGEKYEINWNEIEYLDFVYEMETDYGIKVCNGTLYFKHKNKPYEVEVSSIFNGREYKLVKIKSLYEQY